MKKCGQIIKKESYLLVTVQLSVFTNPIMIEYSDLPNFLVLILINIKASQFQKLLELTDRFL